MTSFLHRLGGFCLVFAAFHVSAAIAAAQNAATQPTTRAAPVVEIDVTGLTPPDLPDDLTVWPNKTSRANSDPWLWQNHDQIRKMRPRVLVLNFANDVSMEDIHKHVIGIIKATAEATRYHGFENPNAPAFIEYEVAKFVDLRDKNGPNAGKRVTSALFPKKPAGSRGPLIDYAALYTQEFAEHYGFRDPRQSGRYLNLHELINAGYVHELWFYAVHGDDGWPGLETCELKQFYDEDCKPIEGKHGQAGNGRDRSIPWSGRSFRIAFFNPHRGIGCAMENYGHTLEWIAHSRSIPYYRKYFYEFAELALNQRFDVPFRNLYRTDGSVKDSVTYPDSTTMVVKIKDQTYTIKDDIAYGGNVHFPPGARHHYDLTSKFRVLSTIETYRMYPGKDRREHAKPFDRKRFTQYKRIAPDCMGAWMVYWRQCMPGLDNRSLDDDGKPMKNWWPFLFY